MRCILTYHSIDDSGSRISLPRSVLAQQVAWLRTGRVLVTSIPELLALPADADALALTFDDGFFNFATDAAPLLSGLPVTLFVVTDHVGGSNEWGGRRARGIPTLPLLDWPALRRLAAGGVTLGAHTRTHADLAAVPESAIEDELGGCAERLENETGVRPEVFAYPYGSLSPRATAAAAEKFRCACTTELRCLGTSERAAELPRLDMYYFRQSGQLETWGTPQFPAYLAWRRLLRRSRALLQQAVFRPAGWPEPRTRT